MLPFARMLEYGNVRPPLTTFDRPLQTQYTNVTVLKDNTLYGYGNNNYGQLGVGDSVSKPSFITCKTGVWKYWLGVLGSLLIGTDLNIYYSGSNVSFPQIGSNVTTWTNVTSYFNAIGITAADIEDCYIGESTRILLNTGQYVYCGRNNYGECGNGTSGTPVSTLTIHPTLTGISKLRGAFDGTHFVTSSGSALFCGRNFYGEGGIGSTSMVPTPTTSVSSGVLDISTNNSTTWWFYTNGQIWWAGSNSLGQAGIGSTSPSSVSIPNRNTTITYSTTGFQSPSNLTNTGIGSPIFSSSSSVRHSGTNTYGQIGNGTLTTPVTTVYSVPLTSMGTWDNVAYVSKDWCRSFILTKDWKLYAAGGNTAAAGAALPDGTGNKSTFYQITGLPF